MTFGRRYSPKRVGIKRKGKVVEERVSKESKSQRKPPPKKSKLMVVDEDLEKKLSVLFVGTLFSIKKIKQTLCRFKIMFQSQSLLLYTISLYTPPSSQVVPTTHTSRPNEYDIFANILNDLTVNLS